MTKTYNNLYSRICDINNLLLAWRKARKGKTRKPYVIEFEKDTIGNLFQLQKELIDQTYQPKPLATFIIRDPKTRKISKSTFRDRIVHHALVRIIDSIFDKRFIYDSCANRKEKGNLFAIKRFDEFKRKVSRNGMVKGWFNNNQVKGYCFKADIKHYFEEINHGILITIIKRKISDEKVIWLIEKILNNLPDGKLGGGELEKGMPLGNLTSQFFANVYLNELDYFIKHKLRAKYYLRYVDDFVIIHNSKEQLEIWKKEIEIFLKNNLRLELHPQKSRIISLSKGIDFVDFRNFYYYRLLRKRNAMSMKNKVNSLNKGGISYEKFLESFQGWKAYAKWANSYELVNKIITEIQI